MTDEQMEIKACPFCNKNKRITIIALPSSKKHCITLSNVIEELVERLGLMHVTENKPSASGTKGGEDANERST